MSTDKSRKLNELLIQQQSIIEELKAEADGLDTEDVILENERLTSELTKAKEELGNAQKDNTELQKELRTAKDALFARLAEEKLGAFLKTQKKIDSYYYNNATGLGNRLNEYENFCRDNINKTLASIEKYGQEQFGDIRTKLESINSEFEKKSADVRAYYQAQTQNVLKQNNAQGSKLYNEPLSKQEKNSAFKKKNFESFIGLNLLSKAGILLLLIGIAMLGKFAYTYLSDFFKMGLISLLGIVLILVGELFNKKEKTVFSSALISGGVAVLYASVATGHFAFGLYSVSITFLLCVIVTAAAIFLSHQVKSQVVCAFAAVGGYLPVIVSYMIGFGKAAADISFLPVSCVYFFLLSVIIFLMSYNKNWHISRFIGYALQIISVGGVASCAWAVKDISGYVFALPLAAAFAAVTFGVYTLYPAFRIMKKLPLSVYDILLFVLNTVTGAVSVSFTVRNCFYNVPDIADKAMGTVFLIMTVIYLLLMTAGIKTEDKNTSAAVNFSACASLLFSMSVIPLIFGFDYAPAAWAAEGVAIAVTGIAKRLKVTEIAGLVCMTASLAAYYMNLYPLNTLLAVISFGIIASAFWIYTVRSIPEVNEKDSQRKLCYITEIIGALISAEFLYTLFGCVSQSRFIQHSSTFTDSAVRILCYMAAAVLIRTGLLKNKVSLIFSDIMGAAVWLATALLVCGTKYSNVVDFYGKAVPKSTQAFVNIALLVILNIAAEYLLAVSAADLIKRSRLPVWTFTAAVSITSIISITLTVMKQFGVPFPSVIISAVYIAAACVLLIVGFKKDFTVVRFGGLVLILSAFAKLCFVDTRHLDSGWKIASYFAFGGILILISYFYQRFNKKLEMNYKSLNADSVNEKTE